MKTYKSSEDPCDEAGTDTEKKMNLLKISRFPDFVQYSPDFSLTKFFKVRKCERCGSLVVVKNRGNVVKNREAGKFWGGSFLFIEHKLIKTY